MDNLAVKQLSVSEKLRLMETLWDDLREQVGTEPMPQSHQELLDERRRNVTSGIEPVLNWEVAKGHIRQNKP